MRNSSIKLSIVTINFNDGNGLNDTKKSIVSQECQDFEWLVIDGNSSDDSLGIIKNTNRIDYYVSEKDNGIYDAMRKGLMAASGRYVIFMNSGDRFFNASATKKIIRLIEDEKKDLYLFATQINGLNSSYIRKPRSLKKSDYSVPAVQQSTVYRSDLLKEIDWPIEYKICGDFSIALQLYNMGASYLIDCSIISIFELGGVSTQRPLELTMEALRIQKKYSNKPSVIILIYAARRLLMGCFVFLLHKIKKHARFV